MEFRGRGQQPPQFDLLETFEVWPHVEPQRRSAKPRFFELRRMCFLRLEVKCTCEKKMRSVRSEPQRSNFFKSTWEELEVEVVTKLALGDDAHQFWQSAH